MKRKLIPSAIGVPTIILFAVLAGAFIYLSTSAFEDEMSIQNQQTLNFARSKFAQWFLKDRTAPYADITFQYDQKQRDKMIINNYEISATQVEGKITRGEIDALMDCYKDKNCQKQKISQQVNNIINSYKHNIVKDEMIIVYGLATNEFTQKSGQVDTHMFIIGENIFIDIANPIVSKTNAKYINSVKKVDTGDADSKVAQRGMGEMENEIWKEIFEEQTPEVTKDLKSLERVSKSIQIIPREE